MPVTISYKTLDDPSFESAIRKLANYPKFRAKMLRWTSKIADKYLKELKLASEIGKKLAKQFGKLDEKGELVAVKESPGFQVLEGQEDAWKKAKEEFEAQTFLIHVEPVALEMLEEVGLSALEIIQMEPFLLSEESEKELETTKKTEIAA